MKNLIRLAITTAFLLPTLAFAGSGKAIVPHWNSAVANTPTYVFISNITDNYINVTVTFYDRNGNTVPVTTYDNMTSTQIYPNQTGRVTLTPTVFDFGYATIEWENVQGDNNTVALIAHGYKLVQETDRANAYAIPINNGMPF